MKILQINNSYNKFGGAESVFFNTIELLEQNGHQVIPFSLNSTNNIKSKYSKYFVDEVKILHNKFYSFISKKKITELLKNEKPDIAHIHNIIGGLSFSILPVLKKMGIPIVASIHDFRLLCPAYVFLNGNNEICEKCVGGKYYNCTLNNCSKKGLGRSVFVSLESYLRDYFINFSDYFDSMIFVSDFERKKFADVISLNSKKAHTVYNFTKQIKMYDNKGDYFLYFGRLAPEKSLFTLLDAFSYQPELKLRIVGKGELEEQLKLKKTENVELVGYKTGNDLIEEIKNSSFVIASSECYETNSMITLEAYALGKPVIGSEIGAIPELIINGKTGFLYEAKNSKQLSSILYNSSMLNSNDYKIFSRNAYEMVGERFSNKSYYNLLLAVYNKTLK